MNILLSDQSDLKSCFFKLLLLLMLCIQMFACGVRPLTQSERSNVEFIFSKKAQSLIEAKELPNRAPLTSLELVRTLFGSHHLLQARLPVPLTPGELIATSVRRPGGGQIGDLIVFKERPRTLDYAIVFEVLGLTRYRAIGILLGEVKQIEIDLAHPQARRNEHEIINTVIRPISVNDKAPHLYLAGALFQSLDEFSRLVFGIIK